MIHHIVVAEACKELLRAFDLGLLDGFQLQTFHRPLRLGNEEDMLDHPLVEGDRPVRRVVPHGRRDMETLGQLRVDADLIGCVHPLRHAPLDAFSILGIAVGKEVALHILLLKVH